MPVEACCEDGVDNDGNGKTDCADPDCASDPACTVPPAGVLPRCANDVSATLVSSAWPASDIDWGFFQGAVGFQYRTAGGDTACAYQNRTEVDGEDPPGVSVSAGVTITADSTVLHRPPPGAPNTLEPIEVTFQATGGAVSWFSCASAGTSYFYCQDLGCTAGSGFVLHRAPLGDGSFVDPLTLSELTNNADGLCIKQKSPCSTGAASCTYELYFRRGSNGITSWYPGHMLFAFPWSNGSGNDTAFAPVFLSPPTP
jgi:hypothetical protein